MRSFELPNRSLTLSTGGIAATSHPAASLAAVEIMRDGGNPADAALAASAVLCVVESGSTRIGGDCFWLYAPEGKGEVLAYNGSGRAPAAAEGAWFRGRSLSRIAPDSAHSVTVPGAVEAWERLWKNHGTRPLGVLPEPAIRLGRSGYAVTPRVACDWKYHEALLSRDAEAARIFLPGGTAPETGTVRRQPDLADTLEAIGREGARAFYDGPIAGRIVETLRSKGGLHELRDFTEARGEYVEPISTEFRRHMIVECPPNGQGVVALMILNILSGIPCGEGPLLVDRLHEELEATRLAYSVRDAFLADPAQSHVPIEWLLSRELADRLRARIDFGDRIADLCLFSPPDNKDTVYISVVDKDRNAISFINSPFSPYGSGIVAPETGVLLHNRASGFSLEEGHPNEIAPGKRPMHTIIPGMALRDGRVAMSFGVMGGHYQAMGHAHFISKVLDYGLDEQAALELPRLFAIPGTDHVEIEGTFPPDTVAELERRGFRFVPPARAIGGGQSIRIDWQNGTLIRASDPRKDGCALGTLSGAP